MSIAPVSSFPPERTESSSTSAAGSGQPSQTKPALSPTAKVTAPVSASSPNREAAPVTNVTSTYVSPQDVVEVHQDPETKGEIIIQYVNKAQDVVLQVPSSQELDVQRGIAQDVQEAAKVQADDSAAAASAAKGVNTHGD